MGRSIMTRKEMLATLGKLKFALIWPGNWEDVGFTMLERPGAWKRKMVGS